MQLNLCPHCSGELSNDLVKTMYKRWAVSQRKDRQPEIRLPKLQAKLEAVQREIRELKYEPME